MSFVSSHTGSKTTVINIYTCNNVRIAVPMYALATACIASMSGPAYLRPPLDVMIAVISSAWLFITFASSTYLSACVAFGMSSSALSCSKASKKYEYAVLKSRSSACKMPACIQIHIHTETRFMVSAHARIHISMMTRTHTRVGGGLTKTTRRHDRCVHLHAQVSIALHT